MGTAGDYATVACIASIGRRLWVSRYEGPAHQSDQATALAVSPAGAMAFVIGETTGASSDFDYATVAYSA